MGARQLVEIGLRIAKKLDFPFPLLCDTDRKIGLAYGAGNSASGIIGRDGLDGVNACNVLSGCAGS
jgi:peroxiredoxin